MTLAVDITDGCGLSNEAHHWLLTAKEEQDNAVFAVHFIATLLTKRSTSVLKVGICHAGFEAYKIRHGL